MTKKKARILLAMTLLCGFATSCLLVGVSLYGGIIDTKNLGETFAALVATYSASVALLFGALQAGKHENGRASKNSFVLAWVSIILWNLLIVSRVAWFASTAFSSREDSLARVLEFWTVAGGAASFLVVGPIGFFITKHEL
jgi:hypothetical protein